MLIFRAAAAFILAVSWSVVQFEYGGGSWKLRFFCAHLSAEPSLEECCDSVEDLEALCVFEVLGYYLHVDVDDQDVVGRVPHGGVAAGGGSGGRGGTLRHCVVKGRCGKWK